MAGIVGTRAIDPVGNILVAVNETKDKVTPLGQSVNLAETGPAFIGVKEAEFSSSRMPCIHESVKGVHWRVPFGVLGNVVVLARFSVVVTAKFYAIGSGQRGCDGEQDDAAD